MPPSTPNLAQKMFHQFIFLEAFISVIKCAQFLMMVRPTWTLLFFLYILEDDLLLPSNKITQLPENMTAVCSSCTVLPNCVIVGNYLSVAPSSANVRMKQLNMSLLNAKIHTHRISSFKRYWECDCNSYCCTSTHSNVAKCIGDALVKNTAALAHIVM